MEVKENQIINELLWLSEKMFGKQKAYYDRMLADATPIQIAPLSEVFDEETIKLIKTQIRPEPKLCFKNATLLCTMFPDRVKYVEGKFTVAHTISTEHAWNKVGDKYIDITMEIALECNPSEEEYIALLDQEAENKGYDVVGLFITDIINQGSYIYFNHSSKDIWRKSFHMNDLEEGTFIEGCISRKKQMVPAIMKVLDK